MNDSAPAIRMTSNNAEGRKHAIGELPALGCGWHGVENIRTCRLRKRGGGQFSGWACSEKIIAGLASVTSASNDSRAGEPFGSSSRLNHR